MSNKFNNMTTEELISWTINYSGDIAAKILALDYERVLSDIEDVRSKLDVIINHSYDQDTINEVIEVFEHVEMMLKATKNQTVSPVHSV